MGPETSSADLYLELQRVMRERDAHAKTIGERITERDNALREIATLHAERDAARATVASLDNERHELRELNARAMDRIKALGAEVDRVRADHGSVVREGWFERFGAFRRTFIGEYGKNIEGVAESIFDAVASFLENESRIVDAEFHGVVTEAERDALLARLERVVEIGDDVASMLSDMHEEVRIWKKASAEAKTAPELKAIKSMREAHSAQLEEKKARLRVLAETVKKSGPALVRVAELEARVAAAISWIEHLAGYVPNEELVKAAGKFCRMEEELPF